MRRFRGLCIRGGRGTRKSRGSKSGQELKHNQQAMADGQGCSNNSAIEQNKGLAEGSGTKNIILNHDFSKGLQFWHPNSCNANTVLDAGGHYVVVTNRKESWQGLEQDISGQVVPHLNYNLSSLVRIGGDVQGTASVQATLRLDFEGSSTEYQLVSRVTASIDHWAKLTGSFSLSRMPKRVIFYFEGPPPGVDLQIASVAVFHSPTSTHEEAPISSDGNENIMQNSNFEDGLNNWSGRGCKIVIQESIDGKVLPLTGKVFASAINRSQSWNGIQQEITSRVQRKTAYNVFAVVRLHGTATAAIVRATLWVQNPNGREQYIGISSLQASDTEWSQLQGKFLLNGSPSRVVIYLEGPPPGTDILLNSMVVKHAERATPLPPPDFENVLFGENIVANSNLNDSLSSWFPLGSCTLSIADGSPHVIPPMARESLGLHEPLNGRYILVSNRTQTWMGPAQTITDRLKLHVTYQVSAWVRVGPGGTGRQNVNIALGVDSQWVNGGQVDIVDNTWHEIGGSFRIEKQPSKVIVYLQGPSAGIDLMVAGLHIFPVDRKARFKYLRRQTDKVRKRDIVIKFSGSDTGTLSAAFVKIRQFENSFPIGSCVNRTNIDNEDFVQFFVKNFNWGVFGNELKWYWTESQQGTLNYTDADELLDFCSRNGIKARGHCIFWEVDGTVQSWVKSLSKDDLKAAVQNRLTSLLSRYKGKFEHYDVDNEMLHGSFYQDRLGKDIRAYMFKTTHQFDPSATLFVNDYHVEDGTDPKASPEMYIQQILDLQGQGAQVGGIGIQGHIDYPVGPMVCSALDKLATLGLPIWFTELDVSAANEYIRADDLEVMLREAFAHPAVEGIMLWGFWELYMSRDNAFLVDAEGGVNEAGKRYLELKKEWLTHAHGQIDDNGEFRFRGFQGTYHAEIVTMDKKISQDFVVIGGDSPFEVTISF